MADPDRISACRQKYRHRCSSAMALRRIQPSEPSLLGNRYVTRTTASPESGMPIRNPPWGRRVGSYVRSVAGGETMEAFVPMRLPPSKPPLDIDRLSHRLLKAEHALTRLDLGSHGGRLGGLDRFLPGRSRYSRKRGCCLHTGTVCTRQRGSRSPSCGGNGIHFRLAVVRPIAPPAHRDRGVGDETLSATKPTATRAVDAMVKLGVLKETMGSFAYQAHLDRLKVGTDLDLRR